MLLRQGIVLQESNLEFGNSHYFGGDLPDFYFVSRHYVCYQKSQTNLSSATGGENASIFQSCSLSNYLWVDSPEESLPMTLVTQYRERHERFVIRRVEMNTLFSTQSWHAAMYLIYSLECSRSIEILTK